MEKKIFNKSRVYTPLLLAVMLTVGSVTFANDRVVVPVPDTLDINNDRFESLKHESSGAGIYNEGTVNIQNTSFKNNSIEPDFPTEQTEISPYDYTVEGAAVSNYGEMNIENSTFENNTTSALYHYFFKVPEQQVGSIVQENIDMSLGYGGAIANHSNTTISDSIFKNNIVAQMGGAIFNDRNGTLNLIGNNEFIGNKAYSEYFRVNTYKVNNELIDGYDNDYNGFGGAISNNGSLKINGAKFNSNIAAIQGGAINSEGKTDSSGTGKLEVLNSSFENNIAKSNRDSKLYDETNHKWKESHIIQGAGGAISTSSDTIIKDSTFIANEAGTHGGAVDFYGSNSFNSKLNIQNSIFDSNKSGQQGGAVNLSFEKFDEDVTIPAVEISNSEFKGNFASLQGGAICNEKDTILALSESNFDSNKAYTKYKNEENNEDNPSLIPEIINQIETGAKGNGGAIYNENIANINNSTFNNNIAAQKGGAIYNKGTLSVSGGSKFSNNTAKSEYDLKVKHDFTDKTGYVYTINGIGGAIHNEGTTVIDNAEFSNNIAGFAGGAIANGLDNNVTDYTDTYSLDIKNSTFKNNSTSVTKWESHVLTVGLPDENLKPEVIEIHNEGIRGNGGAIFNGYNSVTNVTDSYFVENSAYSGGAIYNLEADVNIKDTSFVGNKAEFGGAIASESYALDIDKTPSVNISAENKNIEFKDNTANQGADIYLRGSNLNLNTTSGKSITFNGGITGESFAINYQNEQGETITKEYIPNININNKTVGNAGTVVFNAPVVPVPSSRIQINVKSGNVVLNNDSNLNDTEVILASGTFLDLSNNKAGTMSLNTFSADNANIAIDIDAENKNFDTIVAKGPSTGTLNLTNVNLVSDFENGVNSYTTAFTDKGMSSDLSINSHQNFDVLTNKYLYTINADGKNLNISRLVDDENKTVEIDGFSLAISGSDTISQNNKDINLADERSFSANEDIVISGSGLQTGWTGNLGGTELTVNGNGYTIDGNQNSGIVVNNNQTLKINDTNISNFKTSAANEGALTVKDGGKLEINAINNDISINNIISEADKANAIYLDGTTAKADISASSGRTVEIGNDIRSANVSNEMTLRGDGRIVFNGKIDPLTINNENKDTVHNNYIDALQYNINSGSVTFTKDEYLSNPDGNKNSVNFSGGLLNLANGTVNDISLASIELNKNSNISVDADLAAEKMDSISADRYKVTDGKLNVSNINLLSDANKDKTVISFAPDELKGHVTTSVKDVAYSAIYKYGVGYDPTTGEFAFTRGSSSDYANVNPSVMVSSVAAQAGGYLTLLNSYDQAFANMDITMLMSKADREAMKNRNKYAYSDSMYTYAPTQLPEENIGLWARPYSSFESVALRGGPRVSNVMYGSFIGGDSAIKELGHGFEGVFSLYAGYNGSHQAYQGNSIYQNGGTLGTTGTLYKGNWFGAWTANVGANGADANTSRGSENFGMLLAGTAIKTGYNWELFNSKMILQPSYLMSYSFVNTFDYHNAAGVNITSDPLNAIQVVPGIKLVGNCSNGWQPYLGVNFIWNIMDKTKFQANDVSLPELAIRPYVEYGLGVQKRWGERFTGYGQAMFRSGGREGVAFSVGLRSKVGK